MKSILFLTLSIFLFVSLTFSESVGKVSFFLGKVKIKTKTAADWKDARMNLPVADGDQIETGKADRP